MDRREKIKKAGFDPDKVWYHGTNHDIPKFRNDFINHGMSKYGVGFYFTNNPKEASEYADIAYNDDSSGVNRQNVIPVHLKLSKEVPHDKDLSDSQIKKIINDAPHKNLDIPVSQYKGHGAFNAIKNLYDDHYINPYNEEGDSKKFLKSVTKHTGYDHYIRRDLDPKTGETKERFAVVFHPNQIRSVHAKFDDLESHHLLEDLEDAKKMGFDTSKTWYHGTMHDISIFKRSRNDIGIHFGTKDQANARLEHRFVNGHTANHNIIPVHLKLKNPARVDDAGSFDVDNLVPILKKHGYITDKEATEHKTLPKLRDLLERKGYDGLIYKNTYEIPKVAELKKKEIDARNAACDDMNIPLKNRNSFTDEQLQHPMMKKAQEYTKQYQELQNNPINHQDSVIVFHPNQIRSINAKFNRDKYKLGNIMETIQEEKHTFKFYVLNEAKKKLAQLSAGGTKAFKSGNNIILINPSGKDITTIVKDA